MDRKGEVLRRFGLRMAEIRQEKGLTIDTLAALTGLSEEMLEHTEQGRVDVMFTTILVIAHALGVHPEEMLNTLPE